MHETLSKHESIMKTGTSKRIPSITIMTRAIHRTV